MHSLEQYGELLATMRRLSQDLGGSSHLIIKHLDVLFEDTLGPLDEEQKEALEHMGSCARKLSLIASDYDQIFAAEYAQMNVQFEQAELDDRCSHLLAYPAYLAHESRSFLYAIHGFSKCLLDGTLYTPLDEQQKERISEIDGLVQMLMTRIQTCVDTAKALHSKP